MPGCDDADCGAALQTDGQGPSQATGRTAVDVFTGDRALLVGFRMGEPRALRRVYDAYVHDVAALIRGGFVLRGPGPRYVPGVRDPEREMDLVQEAFTKAFSERSRMAYDGLRPYRPFLLQLARNVRLDQLRRDNREPVHLTQSSSKAPDIDAIIEANTPLSPNTFDDPEERLEQDARHEVAQDFFRTLSKDAQHFVSLRFVQGLSQAEVAEHLGVTRRRVRTLEGRLLRGLARSLKLRGLR